MIIQHNLLAMNSSRMFGINSKRQARSISKLSSGYKINRASDDAAGLAISEKMRRQVRGLTQASLNAQDGIGFVQTAEGALAEVHDMLQRMNELAVKSSNGTNTDQDREYLDTEYQQLITDLDRIFDTTTFNEKLIWDPYTAERREIGFEQVQAITYKSYSHYFDASDDNIGILPSGNIKVNATENEVSFSWVGYNGSTYQTGSISMDDFEAQGYSVELSSLFSNATKTTGGSSSPATDLYDSFGNPRYNDTIKLAKPTEAATHADIANTINGTTLPSYVNVSLSANFEDALGNTVSNGFSASATITTKAAYASYANASAGNKFSFDTGQDDFYKPYIVGAGAGNVNAPNYSTVTDAQNDSSSWSIQFILEGVGNVTAQLTGITYSSSDGSDDAQGTWWYTQTYGNRTYTYQKVYSVSTDLKGVMNALTGGYGDSTPGLLNESNGGCNKSSGTINFSFSLRNGSEAVGNLSITTNVNPATDTEETILNKLKTGLSSNTILDLYTQNSNVNGTSNGGRTFYNNNYNKINKIKQPIYTAINDLCIQAGSESDSNNQIHIRYDSLSTYYLGLRNSEINTIDSAQDSIDVVKSAIEFISSQRSDFGAYQNRLEHTIRNLDNVVENTTSAESRIRDADMAKEMVNLSMLNILLKSGTSMIVQANQRSETVLSLLK